MYELLTNYVENVSKKGYSNVTQIQLTEEGFSAVVEKSKIETCHIKFMGHTPEIRVEFINRTISGVRYYTYDSISIFLKQTKIGMFINKLHQIYEDKAPK